MKTDRFTDSIRRKLESIRPEFSEKDWVKMQATLHQAMPPQPGSAPAGHAFSGGSWFSQPVMMAAAAVSTVLLITYGVWQHQQISQLRQTVAQLSQQKGSRLVSPETKTNINTTDVAQTEASRRQPAVPGNDPARSQASPTPENARNARSTEQANRTDTVYITRYLPSPASTLENERSVARRETPASPDRYAATNSPTVSADKVERRPLSSGNQPIRSTDRREATESDEVRTNADGVELRGGNVNVPTETTDANSRVTYRTGRRNRNKSKGAADRSGDWAATTPRGGRYKSTTGDATTTENGRTNLLAESGNAPANSGDTQSPSGEAAQYTLATNRPVTFEPKDWQKALVRRSRSMRPAIAPATVVAVQQPHSQPANPLTVQVRAGVGGEVSSGLWNMAAIGEVLLGKHWTVGVGIGQSNYSVGTFKNDNEFDDRTHHNFRQIYARTIDPKRDIQNIDAQTVRTMMPITLGYRIPITKTLTVLPSIGTYLNLKDTEMVTFYYREQPFGPGFNVANYQASRQVDLFTDFTAATSLEYHKGHWVAQAGPIITFPLQINPAPMGMNWQNTVSAGLRVRTFYQF